MIQTLKNNLLTVEIDSIGAEIVSIKNNLTGLQYLWQGDPTFWKRHSPVLFPIVGSLWQGCYSMDGNIYAMSQHGFARDSEFDIISDHLIDSDEAWLALDANKDTLQAYPRRFRLEIGYKLVGERLTVMWRVINRDEHDMTFQIGAHPAFNYPDFNASDPVHGYLFMDNTSLTSSRLAAKGCVAGDTFPIQLDSNGMLPLTPHTFDNIDTIILEGSQVHRVSMLDKHHQPYLSVLFNAPVLGIWSPRPDAPFVCIEPWYGRCDSVDFNGSFEQRSYVNTLAPGATFNAQYMIIFDNL